MTDTSASATSSSRSNPELEALVALISRLALVSGEASRLATEAQAKLTLAFGATAAPIASTAWVPGIPQSPAVLAATFPEGSGETWYVVIRGREPGMYRTADEANQQTDGVPNQFRQKKTSRREALAFYTEQYNAPVNSASQGVQKWIAVAASSA
ncbi:hypothetical protein B0H11DRAFT_2214445 [Mycena galericulata]|nr:hypothetical protein B0H11DRAFT_2248476 [Mycena galericulata]KAJ7511560.1 hypothetical protein B0H11DRAFT_2214445 [Mycena galericulata]